jgi:outer membrane protein OmpA-like peptidoglycan-associated protein
VKKFAYRSCLATGAAVITAFTAGCGLAGLSDAAAKSATGPAIHLSEHVPSSVFVTVADGTVVGPGLSSLIAATAQPNEDLDILQAAAQPTMLVAAGSPAPASVIVAGKPATPGRGATSYQRALYQKSLKSWQGAVTAGKREVATRTRAATSAWARGLRISGRATGRSTSLVDECALAASALAGLEEAGDRFSGRRVLLLYADNLSGTPSTGELAGDDVIVVTPFLPTAAAASAAQADLLSAGAARAAVLGPEATAGQLDKLIAVGLSEKVITEPLSGSVLFANDSAVLLPGAARVLAPLVALLRHPGAAGVVNGYASTPGSVSRNYGLSQARAMAVAQFFETHAIPASSLVIVGHGASDLAAPGPSAVNRRVVVVIEEPSSSGS